MCDFSAFKCKRSQLKCYKILHIVLLVLVFFLLSVRTPVWCPTYSYNWNSLLPALSRLLYRRVWQNKYLPKIIINIFLCEFIVKKALRYSSTKTGLFTPNSFWHTVCHYPTQVNSEKTLTSLVGRVVMVCDWRNCTFVGVQFHLINLRRQNQFHVNTVGYSPLSEGQTFLI